MVGIEKLRTWTAALMLASVDDKPRELVSVALVRGRMCERLAEAVKSPGKESYFFAGLFSVLEALLDCPMEQVLADLTVSDEIRAALIDQSGPIGQALCCAMNYERPHWEGVQFQGLELAQIRDYYLEAISWANDLLAEIPS
jgi:EAL and modified HD-GYP domain-containing signal transduction protein